MKETFDANFVDALPLDKRTGYGGFIRDNVPGAADGGGQFAGSDWLARVRGANTNQNAILVEGFRMDWHKITLNSLAAMEVLTAGNGADNAGTPGAVVNMVTQGGSNQYGLDVTAWHEDGRLRLFTQKTDVNNDRRQSFFNPAVSGPILKDKLWFYLNVEGRNELISRDPDPIGRGADAAAPLLLEHARHSEADLAGDSAEQDPELHPDQHRGLGQQPRGLRRRSGRPSSGRTGRTTSPASPGSRC